MLKACSRCGRVHPYNYRCTHNKAKVSYNGGAEREARNSWAWHKKSLEIRDKAQNLCEVCRDEGRYVYNGLEVHHIVKVKDDASRLLDDYNLVCLCVPCHKKADRGEIEQGYLRELARKREES